MKLTLDNFQQLINVEEDHQLLKKTLSSAFEKHFNLLVEAVPSISSIEWKCEQEDEMVYSLMYFTLVKNNGYTFNYEKYEEYQELPLNEFNERERKLIYAFKEYLDDCAATISSFWVTESLMLKNDNNVEAINDNKLKM